LGETLLKLSPHRDLQVYFERPSAIAAIFEANASGFKVSGTWRQQFDWAVIEWNQHNTFEHPLFRTLPDGDLSGLTLTYDETRENCIALDSDLYPTVDWPYLRVWTRTDGVDGLFRVRLKDYAVPIEGDYLAASAVFTLTGIPDAGDYAGLSLLDEHYTYEAVGGDTAQSVASAIAGIVNQFSSYAEAAVAGATITVWYSGLGQTLADSTVGANGNRVGIYGFLKGTGSLAWDHLYQVFSGGTSPSKWRFTLPLGGLVAEDGLAVPATSIRKLRWTYAAELQTGPYGRSEFLVGVSNWSVSGSGRAYQIAGRGAQRMEDERPEVVYGGEWTRAGGNFSGGTIRYTTAPGSAASLAYEVPHAHYLAIGTRMSFNATLAEILVDGSVVKTENLLAAGEDQLVRLCCGPFTAGEHTVELRHAGTSGGYLYFDFFETYTPAAVTPDCPEDTKITLATDWDTDHSIAVPAERTAWMIRSLGFRGRVNHYVGALWFYEMYRKGHQYASATIDFTGTAVFSAAVTMRIGRDGYPAESDAVITHLVRIGDTLGSLAEAFALELNRGYTAIRAEAFGNTIQIFAREMGAGGNSIRVSASSSNASLTMTASGDHLGGGVDGKWCTDLDALPRINRACRDWSRAFYADLAANGMDSCAAFSTELQHGDRDLSTGIAQRYPNGDPVLLNTPALQTNFSPASYAYWKDVYAGMAQLMQEGSLLPYLQFGEVQWWYFPQAGSGMTFYDDYAKQTFLAEHGRPMAVIASHWEDPSPYLEELAFLSALIGTFTTDVMAYVRASQPTARFEVLYPTDVNDTPLNALVNYPGTAWTESTLDCLKTESFTYTFARDLDKSRTTITHGALRGFSRGKRSFLVGIGDSTSPWRKEVEMAKAENLESIVLFALDQFCLIGYEVPIRLGHSRSLLAA